MPLALLGFGANLGSSEEKYLAAISQLHAFPGISVLGATGLSKTNPIGGPANQPPFHNAAIFLEVDFPPLELFAQIQSLESALGRTRAEHWGPRAIDLDLLFYNDLKQDIVINTDTLTLPHPRVHYRRFALAPVAELQPNWVHPLFHLTIAQLLQRLDRAPRITAIAASNPNAASEFARQLSHRSGAPLLQTAATSPQLLSPEYITPYAANATSLPPPQLVIWIDSAPPPNEFLSQVLATRFSTWAHIDCSNTESSLNESTAAVAAMRPFT